MIEQPGVRLGRIEGNPFQAFVRKAGERIGLRYVLNVVLDGKGEIQAAACGEPSAVHDYLSGEAAKTCSVDIDKRVHLAIAGVPEAKGANLYQASRAATYLALAERSPLVNGAPIVLPARIAEGAGEGTGERRFFDILSAADSPLELVDRLRRDGFPAGAQRAFILAQVLARHPVIVAGADHPDVVRACHMIPANDIGSAIRIARELIGAEFVHNGEASPHLLILQNGLTTLARLTDSA